MIAGWDSYAAGKAKAISGIETPDAPRSCSTSPGRRRLPLPRVDARDGADPARGGGLLLGRGGRYGRDVVSTGPYMIAGMDRVDASSCAKIKPAKGFDGQTTLSLVRNPDYAAATDSRAARENLPDQFVFSIDANLRDIVDRIGAGQLDDVLAPALPAQTLSQYSRDPKLRPRLHLFSNDSTNYITMNLTQPPFDDVHVRRALNWVMDKTALQQAWGGPLTGKVAHHIAPDTLFDNQLSDYDPYRTPGTRKRRPGEGGHARVEVRHEARRHVRGAPSARTSCSSPTRTRWTTR